MGSTSLAWDNDGIVANRPDGGAVRVSRLQTEVISLDFSKLHPVPVGARSLSEFMREFQAQQHIAEHLGAARQEVARDLASEGRQTRLSHLRLARGMSQSDLAKALGCSQSMVSLLETRQQKPGEDTIRGLAHTLEVDFNTLFAALLND